MTKHSRKLVALLSVISLTGCTDLVAVRDISSRLQSASQAWNDVGGEFLGSCQRELQINPSLVDCATQKDASDGLTSVNAILANYFKALGDTAADTNYSIQPGLDKASASATKIPGINSGQVNAVAGLVGVLAKFVTEQMRESTLRNLIDDGAPHARTLVAALDSLVVTNLSSRLATERTSLDGFFLNKIRQQEASVNAPLEDQCKGSTASQFGGTGYLLTIAYCQRIDLINKRVIAISNYQKSLAAADKALVELQSGKTNLTSKALLAHLYAIGQDLDDKVVAVQKAFA